MEVIKVSGKSRPPATAGAIAGVFREHQHAVVQAIGAGAVNQAVKALILARSYLAADGYRVVFTPEFAEVEIEGKERTAIRFTVTQCSEAEAEGTAEEVEADGDEPSAF